MFDRLFLLSVSKTVATSGVSIPEARAATAASYAEEVKTKTKTNSATTQPRTPKQQASKTNSAPPRNGQSAAQPLDLVQLLQSLLGLLLPDQHYPILQLQQALTQSRDRKPMK